MDEKSRKNLSELSVEQLTNSYKNGAISYGRYNSLLHAKAHITLEDANLTNPADYAKLMWQKGVEHFQGGWDNVVEAGTRDTSKDTLVLSDLYYSGLAAWGMWNMLMAPLTAWGEVNGETARRLALSAGASSGAAWYIGLAVDLASGFVPAGKIAQSGAKGVSALAGKGALGKTLQEINKAGEVLQTSLVGRYGAGTGIKAAEGTSAQGKLNLSATEIIGALSDVIKPGMTKEVVMQEALKKLQGAEGAQIDAAAKKFLEKNIEGWFHMQPSQAEIPFRVMGEALGAEGVKLNPILEAVTQTKPVAEGVAKLSDAARSVGSRFADDVTTFAKGTTIDAAKKDLPKLAEKLGINLADLKNITPGGRFDPKNAWYSNPKKMWGYLKAIETRATEMGPLAKAALEGDDNAKIQFAKYLSELFTSNPDGKIKYGKEMTDMLMHWDPENMAKGDIAAAVTTFAKDMAHMADNAPEKVANFMFNNQVGAFTMAGANTAWKYMREIYISSLLPWAWKAAFLGNSYATANMVLERAVGAMFSVSKTGYTNKEAIYLSKGLAWAMGDGTKAFADAFRNTPQLAGRFSHTPMIPPAINIPMSTIRGVDNFFSAIIQRASHYAVAAREGEQVFGLKGAALGAHIRQRLANPTQEMLDEAIGLAQTATFQNQLGGFAGQLQKTLQWGPMIFFFPFIKSGINLGKYAWARTPGLQLLSGQLYKDIAAGGAKADAAVARLVMGQMMGHMYMELAKDGIITGGGPVDPQVRKVWLLTHQPYSIRTPAGWIPLSNMEPANTPAGMVADVVEVIDHLDEPTAEQAMAAIGFSFFKNFTNGTWWQNASDLQDVAQGIMSGTDFSNSQYRFLRSPMSGFMQITAQPTRINDPIQRQTRSVIDDIRAKWPWTSKTQPPVRDAVGDPVVPPIAFIHPWFGLMRPIVPAWRPYETDPLRKELDRLEAKAPLFSDHIGGKLHEGFNIQAPRPGDKFGIRLNNAELDQRYQNYRRILRHSEFGIEAFINDPETDWKNGQKWTDAGRRAEVERMMEQAWKNAGDALLIQKPELAKKVMESDASQIMARTPDIEKEATRAELDLAVNDFMESTPEELDNLTKFGIIGPREPDNMTTGTPYGPLMLRQPVAPGTPGAITPQEADKIQYPTKDVGKSSTTPQPVITPGVR